MGEYFEIVPLDTLFFRGTTPMEAGQMISMFPPPISVVQGAIWTAVCLKQGKKFDIESFPFSIIAMFVKKQTTKGEKFYFPAPATWYYDAEKKVSTGKDCKGKKLLVAENCNETFQKLGMKSSAGDVVFVKPEIDAQSFSGAWISEDFLTGEEKQFTNDAVLLQSDIFSTEIRTGIGIDEHRAVQKGKLYSSVHIRLHPEISLIIQVDENPGLEDFGKIFLGGERRISAYRKINEIKCNFLNNRKNEEKNQFVSLVPIEATEENVKEIISSGKFQIIAGWDLKKGFHKPTTSWIPAGAVFRKKIHNSCVPLR